MKFLVFISEDFEVFVNEDKIVLIESIGDTLTIRLTDGSVATYKGVTWPHWSDCPRINYPDIVIEEEIRDQERLRVEHELPPFTL